MMAEVYCLYEASSRAKWRCLSETEKLGWRTLAREVLTLKLQAAPENMSAPKTGAKVVRPGFRWGLR